MAAETETLRTWLSQCQAVLSCRSVSIVLSRRTASCLGNGLGTLQLAHSKCVCKKFKSHPAAAGAGAGDGSWSKRTPAMLTLE